MLELNVYFSAHGKGIQAHLLARVHRAGPRGRQRGGHHENHSREYRS